MSGAAELPRLLLVTDRKRAGGEEALLACVADAAAGGVRFLQLREKDLDTGRRVALGHALRAAVAERVGVEAARELRLVVNDDWDAARVLGAGLHLPATRLSAAAGCLFPLGISVHDPAETGRALKRGPDYLVAGTIHETASKPGRPGIGEEGLAAIARAAYGVRVYAIGGVEAGRVARLFHAGAYGVAVCGAILEAANAEKAARELVNAITRCAPAPRDLPPA